MCAHLRSSESLQGRTSTLIPRHSELPFVRCGQTELSAVVNHSPPGATWLTLGLIGSAQAALEAAGMFEETSQRSMEPGQGLHRAKKLQGLSDSAPIVR